MVVLKSIDQGQDVIRYLARLKHEYRILKSLEHNNIIKALEFFHEDDQYALVMEDIGGISLREVFDKFRGDYARILQLAIQISNALGYIHSQNIVHKDLKPENIVINIAQGSVQIIDFGLASEILNWEQNGNNKKIVGTIKYISPEQTGRTNQRIDQRSDLYTLGIILYELITGKTPFESTQVTEIIHGHIARLPKKINEQVSSVPRLLENLVMKLLEKDPLKRYQSCFGLEADLRHCLDFYANDSWDHQFVLGREDKRNQFSLQNKLYGRDKECKLLDEKLQKTIENQGGSVFIQGPSGVGKSSLIKEVQLAILRKHGIFSQAKFDQFQNNAPYSAFLKCIESILVDIETNYSAELEFWKDSIQEKMGDDLADIIKAIPVLARWYNDKMALNSIVDENNNLSNRFRQQLEKLILILSDASRPIVIFIDDIQWADYSTIGLINNIIRSSQFKKLLLCCAYRDNLVEQGHPIDLMKKSSLREGSSLTNIVLGELSQKDIEIMIHDAISGATQNSIADVSLHLFTKTQGNAFYVREFLLKLVSEGYFKFDHSNGEWLWDLNEIKKINASENVIDFLLNKIQILDKQTQRFLQVASCLGNKFSLNLINELLGDDHEIISKILQTVMAHGLVTINEDANNYFEVLKTKDQDIQGRFVHDRIQQAAYSSIFPEERNVLHLQIARKIKNKIKQNDKELIFDLCDHYKRSEFKNFDLEESNYIAWANLYAGNIALDCGSFRDAGDLFKQGISLANISQSEELKKYVIEAKINYAICESLNSNYDHSQQILFQILKESHDNEIICRVRTCLLIQYTTLGRYDLAIENGSLALEQIDIYFPKKPALYHAVGLLLNVKMRIAMTSPEKILQREIATDRRALQAMTILSNMSTAAYISGPEPMLFLCLRAVDLSLKFGNSPVSAFAYALLAFIESAKLGGIKKGDIYSRLAIELNEKFQDSVYRCKVLLARSCFIQHTFEPIEKSFSMLDESFNAGVKSGDYNFANYSLWAQAGKKSFVGMNIDEIYQLCQDYSVVASNVQDRFTLPVLRVLRRHLVRLSGINNGKYSQDDHNFSNESYIQEQTQHHYNMGLAWHYVYEGISEYFLGNHELALQQFQIAIPYCERFLLGQVTSVEHIFFYALALCQNYKARGSRIADRINISIYMFKLKTFSSHCSENYLGRLLLVNAMFESNVKDNFVHAEEIFEMSLVEAKRKNNKMLLALTYECYAITFEKRNKKKIFEMYMQESYLAYIHWGAVNKARLMIDKYPFLLKIARINGMNLSVSHSTTSFDFDLETILKINKTLSEEKDINTVLATFMSLYAQNSCAEKAELYLLPVENMIDSNEQKIMLEKMRLKATWSFEAGPLVVNNTLELLSAKTILQHNEWIKLWKNSNNNHTVEDGKYEHLCFPIFYSGRIVGIITIANKNAGITIDQFRYNFLKMLADQAGILILNAVLVDALEEKVAARTLELKFKNDELQVAIEENKNLIKILCHDLNNTLSILNMALAMGLRIGSKPGELEKNSKLWNMVKQSVETQNAIIHQVRSMMAVASNKQQLQLSVLSVADIFKKVYEHFIPILESKGIILMMEHKNENILAEETTLINTVLSNILSNAIKFSSRGGIIRISTQSDNDWVMITIKDSGIGMPDEIRHNVFKKDKQTSRIGTEGEKGTGFGMPLVKNYMEHFGGKIKVESKDIESFPDDHGTTFTIYFKFDSKNAAQVA